MFLFYSAREVRGPMTVSRQRVEEEDEGIVSVVEDVGKLLAI